MLMDPAIIAAGISAGSKLVGSFLDSAPSEKGGNMRNMREANTAAIMGKVNAAKAAGISPLYALGAPTVSPSFAMGGGSDLGTTISGMGADISRAVAAQKTPEERALMNLSLEGAGLDNEFKRAQIRKINADILRDAGPSFPPTHAPNIATPKLSPPQFTPEYDFLGIPLTSNPYVIDSQTKTNRLGEAEILETLNAIGTLPADAYWTLMGFLSGSPYYRKSNRLDMK